MRAVCTKLMIVLAWFSKSSLDVMIGGLWLFTRSLRKFSLPNTFHCKLLSRCLPTPIKGRDLSLVIQFGTNFGSHYTFSVISLQKAGSRVPPRLCINFFIRFRRLDPHHSIRLSKLVWPWSTIESHSGFQRMKSSPMKNGFRVYTWKKFRPSPASSDSTGA